MDIEEISSYRSLYHQLREHGLKFKDDVNSDFFEEILKIIETLYLYDYITKTEVLRIKKDFIKN